MKLMKPMELFLWKRFLLTSALAASAFGTQGCYVYSAFQGARVLVEEKMSISPSASVVSFGNDGESSWMTTQFGARGGVGLGNGLEIQGRYERMQFHERGDADFEFEGANYVDIGLKYGVVPDRVAIGMPIGFMFGENVDEGDSFQIQPSLFLTIPVISHLDINASTKALFFTEDFGEPLLAFNGGLGIRTGRGEFSLLPEMGLLINPGENGYFWHWGMGASVEF